MTRFDERLDDEHTRTLPAVVRVYRADPVLHVVAVLVVMVVLSIGAGALLFTGELSSRWTTLTGSNRLTVLLDPQLPRVEAERLKTSIEALPQVAAATFLTREAALARIADAGLPAVQARANPLPDVWSVALAPTAAGDVDSQQTRVERLKAALSHLPGVESVQVDARWIAWIDRWAPTSRAAIQWMLGLVFGATGIVCLATSFLVGRAAAPVRETRRRVLALVGLVSGTLGAIAAGALVWSAAATLGWAMPVLEPGRRLLALDVGQALGVMTVLALVACAAGTALGHRKQTVTIDTIVR